MNIQNKEIARVLTNEAKAKLMNDIDLFTTVCTLINVKPNSLSQLVYRNSKRLAHHDVVLCIAKSMSKSVNEILEKAPDLLAV